MGELLPDRLKRLWAEVECGQLPQEVFYKEQDGLLSQYQNRWAQAIMMEGSRDLEESTLSELGLYLGEEDKDIIRRRCLAALSDIGKEWNEKVTGLSQEVLELFYDESEAMIYELMWWHALGEDLSPLAYVVALDFARDHGCSKYLDFGSGVGSGGILFARHGFEVALADISSKALRFSEWRFEQRRLVATHVDLKREKLPEDLFDIVTAMDVFEHLADPVGAVWGLSRAMKRGGYLFGRFYSQPDQDRPHHIVHDFGPTQLAMEESGLVRVWQDRWLWGHEAYQKL